MVSGNIRRYPCPECGKRQHVGSESLLSGASEQSCPFCSKPMTVEDRDGVLFVDGVAVEEEQAAPQSSNKSTDGPPSGAPLPPGASRRGTTKLAGAPLPPGVERSALPKRKKKVEAPRAEAKESAVASPDAGPAQEPPAAPPSASPSALSGTLESVPIADLLMLLVRSQRFGSLTIQSNDNTAKIFVGGGGILGCRHPTPGVNIGTFLVECGIIDQEQLDATQVAMSEATTAGPADAADTADADMGAPPPSPQLLLPTLIATGALGEETAQTAVGQFVDNAVAQVLTWTSGSFAFEPDPNILSDADRVDPQAAYVATLLAPSERLEGAARFMNPPPVIAPEPPASEPEPEPELAAPQEAATKPRASTKWVWLAVFGLLLALGVGGIVAYGFAQDRAECADKLADAETELAKPPDCPQPDCPVPPACETPDTSETDEEGVEPTKAKHKSKKSKGKRKRGNRAKREKDDGPASIDHLLE